MSTFYLHEDDWGMISLEPEENRFERAKVMAEARAFGDAHRAPDGVGWTDMYIAPPPPIALAERAITLTALRELLGAGWTAADTVESGYSSSSEPIAHGYALWRTRDEGVLYGTAPTGVLVSLHLTEVTRELEDVLHLVGNAYRLILTDLWRDEVVELTNPSAIARYLAAGDE